MESECKKPMKMHMEHMDGGESSIASLNSPGADSSSGGGEDGSPNSLPECYEPRIIPPYDLPPRSSSSSSASMATSSGELFQIIPPQVIKSTMHECDELMVLGKSPTQSPPVQVMDRASEASSHDPYRIPAAVFATTPTAPVDWSNTSNDSLFSIRIGNASSAWCPPDTVKPKRELGLGPPHCEEVGDETAAKSVPEGKNKSGGFMTIVEKETDDYPIKDPRATQAAVALNFSSELDDGGAFPKPYCFPMKKKTSGRKSSRTRRCMRIFPCLAWPSWCYPNCCRPCKWRCTCCSSCSLAFCKCIRPWRCFSGISNWAISYACSCRANRKLMGPDPNSRDQILAPQDTKVSSICFSCGSCRSCTCSCFSCSCSNYSCCSRRCC